MNRPQPKLAPHADAQLSQLIEDFDRWRASATHLVYPDSGDDYPHWDVLVDAAVRSLDWPQWDAGKPARLLYVLGFDNEAQTFRHVLARRPAPLIALARFSLRGEHTGLDWHQQARWQLAAALGEVSAETEPLLLQFGRDPDEYVSRRALISLGRIGSKSALPLARSAWQTGNYYRQLAALIVMRGITSVLFGPLSRQFAERHGVSVAETHARVTEALA
jgi:HEAT repeat protein